jgi:peptidyl-prolyl cis-trans isomerase D
MGFTEAHVEEIVEDQLMLDRLKQVVGAGVQLPESESKENYDRAYGKLSVAVARLRSEEIEKQVQISDDDIAKYYEAQKAQLNTEEKRKVSFVTFGLDEEQKKLQGKERVEVLQKLADRANDFNVALVEKGAQFEQVAAKFQMPIATTGEFTKAAPDPQLAANPQLAETAFTLRPEEPNSDAIQAGDSFYVLHLAGVEPPRPLTLEEARPKIVDSIKTQRVREMAAAKGAEAAQKLREAMTTGAPLDAALAQTGLPTEKIPPFALAEPAMAPPKPGEQPAPMAPDLQTIKGAVAEMNPGEVSDFIPTEAGGVVAVVERRESPDPANYEAMKSMFNSRFLQNRREIAFYEWLEERRREAGVPETPQVEFPAAG